MRIFKKNNRAVIAPLSSIAIAIGALGFTATVLADSHIVRRDLNTGVTYNSAMINYSSMDGSSKGAWKQANDTVGKIGGWRTYAKEAYEASKRMDEKKISDVETSESAVEAMANEETNVESVVNEELKSEVVSAEPAMAKSDDKKMEANSKTKPSSRMTPQPIVGLSHQSATDMYRSYEEATLKEWKAANDRVGEIGGWRTYANEAYQANKKMAEEAGASQ